MQYDTKLLFDKLLNNNNEENSKRIERKRLCNFIVYDCNTEAELECAVADSVLTEEKLLDLLENMENMCQEEDDAKEKFFDVYNCLYNSSSIKKTHRLM